MPNWVVMAIFAVVMFAVAAKGKGMFRVLGLFFGLMLSFFALWGALSTWWVWLIAILASFSYVGYLALKRRAKRKKQAEEKGGGNVNNFFFGGPPHR